MRRLTIALFLLLNTACSAPEDIHETRFMMGTLVKFTIAPDTNDINAEAAITAAANEMQRIEDAFTIYGNHPNAVKAFNASTPNTPIALPDEVSALLEIALDIQQQSGGAFNPALGGINLLWGFSNTTPPTSPPSADAIRQALPPPHCIEQTISGWIRTDPRCLLDFGAIAKGYAIDQGIEMLKKHGIRNAIINAGGDIRLIGKHGDKTWRIGIRHPRQQTEVIETLALEGDVSIVTTGDYERFFIHEGNRYHHIINPQTGWPSNATQSATIIAHNATLADAWSTALFVQGKQAITQQYKLNKHTFIIDSHGQQHGSLKH